MNWLQENLKESLWKFSDLNGYVRLQMRDQPQLTQGCLSAFGEDTLNFILFLPSLVCVWTGKTDIEGR